jgi:hypothetical protein
MRIDETSASHSAADIEVLSRDMRLGLVVDSLEQLQELLQLLALFLPQKTHSVLSVTAMRFIEPTLTTRCKISEFHPLHYIFIL